MYTLASLAKARSHTIQTRRAEKVCDGSQTQLILHISRQVHNDDADLTSSQEVKSKHQGQDLVQWPSGKLPYSDKVGPRSLNLVIESAGQGPENQNT